MKDEEKFSKCKKQIFETKSSKELPRCNEDFFVSLNTEKPTYWSGFILGDGCIDVSSLVINISTKDLTHLEKFKNDIDTSCKIKITKRKDDKSKNTEFGMCRIAMRFSKLSKDLNYHGISMYKSNYCTIPKTIPEDMLHHFMRGVFDADGCICIGKSGTSPQFVVVSSVKSFCEEYQQILMTKCNLEKTKIGSNKNNTCFSVKYAGNLQVKRIMDYLYKDATVYLERKFKKFQQHYNLSDDYISSLSKCKK